MGELLHELIVSFRQLRNSRGALASLTLAIGLSVGANLATFTQLYHIYAPASPFADDGRLVILENTSGYSMETLGADVFHRRRLSSPDFNDIQGQQHTFAGLGAATIDFVTVLSGAGRPRTVCRIFVSPHMLDVLGVVPIVGRSLGHADFVSSQAGTVLLTEGVWRRYFAGDPTVIGRSIQLDEQPFSVVGVLPRHVVERLKPRTELITGTEGGLCVITPLAPGMAGEAESVLNYLQSERGRDEPLLLVVGRLRPDISLAEANADLAVIADRLAQQNPRRPYNFGLRAVSSRMWQTREIRGILLMLIGAAVLTLLVACANTAGLLMADGMRRAPEFATRMALGATPGHLMRVVVARSMLWSLPGGIVGLLLASAAGGLTRWSGGADREATDSRYLQVWIVTFSATLTLVVALVSAAAAAWSLRSDALIQSLRDGGPSMVGYKGRRAAMILLTVQVSAAIALTFGAGLLLRSLWNLSTADYGFELQHRLVVEVRLPRSRYRDSTEQVKFYQRALSRVQGLPGVAAAGFSSSPPMTGAVSSLSGDLILRTATESRKIQRLNAQFVTSGYFEALGMKVLRGRLFSQEDEQGGGNNILVDEAFCRRFTAGSDPLEATLWFGQDALRIVGVVADARQLVEMNGMSLAQEKRETVYLSPARFTRPPTWRFLVVRTFPYRSDVASAVADELVSLDASAVVGDPSSFTDLLSTKTTGRRKLSLLLTAMGCIVLLLATASLTAALSQLVTFRSREIAIRYSLGAAHVQIVGLTLKHMGATLASGVLLGVGAGVLFGRALSSQLYGVDSTDPWTFVSVIGVLMLVSIIAASGPLRRTFRIDLPSALRST